MSTSNNQHITWNLDNQSDYSSFSYNYKPTFYFSYTGISNSEKYNNYSTAIQQRLIYLDNNVNKKLAIFISGKDSEIIAIECKKLGIYFELFFLQIGNLNEYMLHSAQLIANNLNVKLNVIFIHLNDVIPYAEESFKLTRVIKPTYLLLPFMFNKIPNDMYIIIGEGDINKSGKSYSKISSNLHGIPILSTEIAYLLHASQLNINGDFYFHSSTPEIIKTVWDHKLLTKSFPYFDTTPIIAHEWGNSLVFTKKTTNWDSDEGSMFNLKIRNHILSKFNPSYHVLHTVITSNNL